MKPKIRLPRLIIFGAALLYLLAGISLLKLLPLLETLSMRNTDSIPAAPAAANGEKNNLARGAVLPNPFSAINFTDTETPITIQITPPHRRSPISITFFTGKKCSYTNHRACVHRYQSDGSQPVIFLTIHSGVDGEAEQFRHYVEGTGINQAGYTLKQARTVINSLSGAKVTISQGDRTLENLRLSAVGRVPPEGLDAYFSVPYPRALNQAAASDTALQKFVYPDQPLIIFETCGWRMPGEKRGPQVSDTTGSIYLAVIQPQ